MADACVHVMNLDEDTASEVFLSYPKHCFINVGSGVDGTIQELDVSILEELGWRPSISLKEGVRHTYQWYLKRV